MGKVIARGEKTLYLKRVARSVGGPGFRTVDLPGEASKWSEARRAQAWVEEFGWRFAAMIGVTKVADKWVCSARVQVRLVHLPGFQGHELRWWRWAGGSWSPWKGCGFWPF